MSIHPVRAALRRLIITVAAVAGISSTCFADTPPQIVYIFTSSPPATISDNGFAARGTDDDFIRFVSGASVEDGTSAYLVLNDSLEQTLAPAQELMTLRPTVDFYLYAIRPSDSFYSVMSSLIYARTALPEGEARQQVSDILVAARPFNVWAARDFVAPSQIYRARRLYLENDQVALGPVIFNPNYLFDQPKVSQHPMPIQNRTVDAAFVGERAHQINFVLLGMDRMGCDAPQPRRKVAHGDACVSAEKLSFEALYAKYVSKLIVLNVLSGPATGQAATERKRREL